MKLLIALLLAALPLGAAIAETNRIDQIRPDAPELAAHGSREIGVRTIEVTNKDQIDIIKVEAGKDHPRYDRTLTLEIWYPAAEGSGNSGTYKAFIRDGKTEVTLTGKAVRDAKPNDNSGAFPLIILSHGYPGNRYLISHFGENLASKGYVVVSIDHAESTYRNKNKFGSTLVNRSLDQIFVLNEMARLSADDTSFLSGIVDTDNSGILGYSMGAYGAVITAGGGVAETGVKIPWGAPDGTLAIHLAGSKSHEALIDKRIKAAIAIGPWGRQHGFWDEKGLAGVRIPMFYMAGSVDDVSDYKNGIRKIYEQSVNTERYLLTFAHANHNAAAPIPAPAESWKPVDNLDFVPFDHYGDAVWNTLRMNNIAQHFATAFFGKYVLGDSKMDAYLDLVEDSAMGKYSAEKDGQLKEDHTYWKGFRARTAKGLTLEKSAAAK